MNQPTRQETERLDEHTQMMRGVTGVMSWSRAGADLKAGQPLFEHTDTLIYPTRTMSRANRIRKAVLRRKWLPYFVGYAGSDIKKGTSFRPVPTWRVRAHE